MKLVALGWWFKLVGNRWLGLQAYLPSSWLLPLAGSLCRLSLPQHQASKQALPWTAIGAHTLPCCAGQG